MDDEHNGLLDVSQAATRLGVPIRWIRRAIAERRIPFVKIGRYVRFIPDDLDNYITARRITPENGERARPRNQHGRPPPASPRELAVLDGSPPPDPAWDNNPRGRRSAPDRSR